MNNPLKKLTRQVGKDSVENIILVISLLPPEKLTPQFARLANLMELDEAEELFRQALNNEDAIAYREEYEQADRAQRIADLKAQREAMEAHRKEARRERRSQNRELAKKGLRVCPRCGGAGGASQWQHTGYTCFRCEGTGTIPKETR